MDTKKYLIILILKLLETSSDEKQPLTQIEIANIISEKYPCDRKTVGRNIGFLIKVGYPIVKTSKGFYLDRKNFTIEETSFILKTIRNSADMSKERTEDIAKRLENVIYKIYR